MNFTCTLRFSDGQCVTASLKTNSCKDRHPINYRGPVERLNWRPEIGDAMDFKVMFRSLAREHHAQIELLEQDDLALPEMSEQEARLAEVERLMLKKSGRRKFAD